jgi:hypothetical protein
MAPNVKSSSWEPDDLRQKIVLGGCELVLVGTEFGSEKSRVSLWGNLSFMSQENEFDFCGETSMLLGE